MIRKLFPIITLLLLSCGPKEKKDIDVDRAKEQLIKKIEIGEISIPVYNFTELDPILNRQDEKTYIFNFWATWCKPCVAELPYFEKINEAYGKKDVEVILVSLDLPDHWESRLVPFVKKRNIKSKVIVLDDPKQNHWIPKVDQDWSGAIPATLIFNGQNRTFYERSFTYEELENVLNEFLKNSA